MRTNMQLAWTFGTFRRLICFASLFALATALQAGVVYDNLLSANSGADPIVGWGPPLFDSFSTGSGGFSLADVQLLLAGTPDAGSLTVSLYNDNATSPGAQLAPIGTVNDAALGSLGVIDLPLGSPYALAPNTRYWIVLNSTDSSANWGWSSDQAAVGVAGEFFGHVTSVFSNSGGPYQMRLSDTGAVPEPSALFLVLAGGCLVAIRRRSAC